MTDWTKEQMEAINDEGTNILVSAGAGSGKTAVLSERVLRKINDGIDVDRILILTFTRPAAYEMMVRIRKKIRKAFETCENQLKKEKLLKQLSLIDKAYITTFDSFSLSIVSKYHDYLGLKKDIQIIDANSIKQFKEEVLNKIFLEYYSKNNQSFNKLITDFCQRDDTELKKYILKLNSSLDLKYDRKEYLDNYIDNYYNTKYIEEKRQEYISLALDDLKKLEENVKTITSLIDDDRFEVAFSNLLSKTNFDDIRTNLNIEIPRLPNNSDSEVKNLKDNISELYEELCTLSNKDLPTLISEYTNTMDYVKVIIDILNELDNRINEYKYQKNVFEFVDIAKLAIKIVKENIDIKEEITSSFDEIMIDEYQDTSDLQELFISLISNNNTYMVGDIKQSIYRFRNANPDIFKEKYLKYEKKISGTKIDLNKNFRSREEVLKNINDIFNEVMTINYGGADYTKSHQMAYGNESYIKEGSTNQDNYLSIYNYNIEKDSEYTKYTTKEIEAFIIAKDIKEKIDNKYQIFDKEEKKLHDIRYNDISILVDRASSFNLYKKIFEYLHIPLTIYKDININGSTEIYLVKNILKLIQCVRDENYSHEFRYSYTSIARSYLFRLDDDYIYNTIINKTYPDTEIYKIVYSIVKDLDKLDLKNLIVEIKERFNFDKHIISAKDISIRTSILEYLIKEATALMNIDYDLDKMITYLDKILISDDKIEIPVSVGDDNSVKIMTIHKSKGLEYPICYYPGLDNLFNIKELSDKILFDNTYGIITPDYTNGYTDTFIKTLVKKNYLMEEISEKIRLFYVSLTRCMEKMILVTHINYDSKKSPNNYKSFSDIINSVSDVIDKYVKNIELDNINITNAYKINSKKELEKYPKNKIDVSEYVSNSTLVEDKHYSKTINKLLTAEEKDNMSFGTKIHNIFELVDFKNPSYDLIEHKYSLYVKRFLEHDIFNNIKDANVVKEYEFYREEKSGIIDLILEYSDHIDIIDYKLKGIDDPNYINQLEGYKDYISTKSNKKINTYLYSILNDELKKI